MEKFCGKCGSRLDEDTGLCPRCHGDSIAKKRTMFRILLVALLLLAVVAVYILISRPLAPDSLSGESGISETAPKQLPISPVPENDSGEAPPQSQTAPAGAAEEDPAAKPAKEIQFHYFEYSEDLDGQYAEIIGLDADHHPQWVYVSGVYDPGTQAPAISEIAYVGGRYYFCEDGAIVVLDAATGKTIWRNWDFSGCCPRSCFGEDGTMYAYGGFGPDFFAVDANGKTLCKIDRFHENYCWPKNIEKAGNKIAVTMDIGPDYKEQKDYVFYVDLNDFSFKLHGSVAEADYPAGARSLEEIRPVLRSDYDVPSDGGEALPSYSVFGSDIEKERIASMKFLDSLSGAPRDAWDVSEAGDGSVLAWVTIRGDEQYDLYIAGEGGVWAPQDCTYLFAEYRWMESLDFNNAFFVENCETMQGMFFHDQRIKELDFSGWDTSTVEDMSKMFWFCSSMKQFDLSQFDTSSVTAMNEMFCRCEFLKKLDLSNFDTSSVTDMSSMFFQSWALEELNLSSFDTSRVTDISMMFFSCESLKKLDISSFDTSSVEESMAIFSGGIHLSELKIGPKFDVSILREAADDMPFMAEGGTLNGYPWETFLKQ